VATATHVKDDLHTILEHWTIVDLYEAHVVLDAIEAAEVRAQKEHD
jgi:hypothetical protein